MLYTICYLLFAPLIVQRTDSAPEKKLIIKTAITTADDFEFRGYLSSINDSTLIVSTDKVHAGSATDPALNSAFHYTGVKKLSFRKKGATGTGLFVGALGGLLLGAVLSASPSDNSASSVDGETSFFPRTGNDAVAAGGALGMISGVVIGGLIGMFATKKFIIKGKKEKLREARNYIEMRLKN